MKRYNARELLWQFLVVFGKCLALCIIIVAAMMCWAVLKDIWYMIFVFPR